MLAEKFQLFEGVFGASDEVLGAIESGVDFEKRIDDIYQRCRKHEEIKVAFDQLQLELSLEINEAMTQTRRKLLENFDDEVREKLKVSDEDSKAFLNRYERLLMQLTRHELDGHAEFCDDSSFVLPNSALLSGPRLTFPSASTNCRAVPAKPIFTASPIRWRRRLLRRPRAATLPPAEIRFSYEEHEGKISTLGGLAANIRAGLRSPSSPSNRSTRPKTIFFLPQRPTTGAVLDEETAARMLSLPGQGQLARSTARPPATQLNALVQKRKAEIQRAISERNARFFEAEADKLDGWADDLKLGLEREIKELDRQIKEARRAATTALTLEEKLAGQKQIKALESQRNEQRRSLFEAQDKVDKQRETLIATIEGKLTQNASSSELFTIRWRLT